jgi:hypothetical protein
MKLKADDFCETFGIYEIILKTKITYINIPSVDSKGF